LLLPLHGIAMTELVLVKFSGVEPFLLVFKTWQVLLRVWEKTRATF